MKPYLILAALVVVSVTAFGQAPLTFEVASVRPSDPNSRGSTFTFNGGTGLTVKNGTLKGMIETAYDVRDFEIVGGPGWVNSERYDVTAKNAFDDPQTRSLGQQDRIKQSRQRLQALLAERFQLKVHRETREMPVYTLVLGKNGSKLSESQAANKPANAGINSGCGQMTGTSASMADLIVTLARELRRPVQDRTGLAARYDFQLRWAPDAGPCADANADGASIFTSIQEQLGLKLEAAKGPVEIIVVDKAAKPDAN